MESCAPGIRDVCSKGIVPRIRKGRRQQLLPPRSLGEELLHPQRQGLHSGMGSVKERRGAGEQEALDGGASPRDTLPSSLRLMPPSCGVLS